MNCRYGNEVEIRIDIETNPNRLRNKSEQSKVSRINPI